MNKNEMAQVLNILQEHYRAERITPTTVLAWLPMFEDYSYQETLVAVKLMGSEREFTSFPAPASIIKYIERINGKPGPNELWNMAQKILGQASTYTKDKFAELPAELQIFFGDSDNLKRMGQADIDDEKFVRNSFFKEYPVIEQRIRAKDELGRLKQGAVAALDAGHVRALNNLLGIDETVK